MFLAEALSKATDTTSVRNLAQGVCDLADRLSSQQAVLVLQVLTRAIQRGRLPRTRSRLWVMVPPG